MIKIKQQLVSATRFFYTSSKYIIKKASNIETIFESGVTKDNLGMTNILMC